jgi:hypothetical protein
MTPTAVYRTAVEVPTNFVVGFMYDRLRPATVLTGDFQGQCQPPCSGTALLQRMCYGAPYCLHVPF